MQKRSDGRKSQEAKIKGKEGEVRIISLNLITQTT
jgi:hypothetical protein